MPWNEVHLQIKLLLQQTLVWIFLGMPDDIYMFDFPTPKVHMRVHAPPPKKIELILHKCIFCAHIICIFSQPDQPDFLNLKSGKDYKIAV